MSDITPLPPGMLAGKVEEFVRRLPVDSIQVEDHRGYTEYAPPAAEVQREAPSAPQSAPAGTPPPWAPPAAPEPQSQAPSHAPEPVVATPPAPELPVEPAAVGSLVFNQPLPETVEVPGQVEEGRDLTLEERVEWLENELAKVIQFARGTNQRLHSLIEVNRFWDGS